METVFFETNSVTYFEGTEGRNGREGTFAC
jgi:hypothetical protein